MLKNTESKNITFLTTKNGRIKLLSKCSVCSSEKSKFRKEQGAKSILSNLLEVKVPILSDIPLQNTFFKKYKMNALVNKLLLAGDKFIPEMHLKQQRFTYSAYGPFTENNERIKIFKETGDSRYIHQYELDKACFQHDMVFGDFKDLNRRTAAHDILRDNEFPIAKN